MTRNRTGRLPDSIIAAMFRASSRVKPPGDLHLAACDTGGRGGRRQDGVVQRDRDLVLRGRQDRDPAGQVGEAVTPFPGQLKLHLPVAAGLGAELRLRAAYVALGELRGSDDVLVQARVLAHHRRLGCRNGGRGCVLRGRRGGRLAVQVVEGPSAFGRHARHARCGARGLRSRVRRARTGLSGRAGQQDRTERQRRDITEPADPLTVLPGRGHRDGAGTRTRLRALATTPPKKPPSARRCAPGSTPMPRARATTRRASAPATTIRRP